MRKIIFIFSCTILAILIAGCTSSINIPDETPPANSSGEAIPDSGYDMLGSSPVDDESLFPDVPGKDFVAPEYLAKINMTLGELKGEEPELKFVGYFKDNFIFSEFVGFIQKTPLFENQAIEVIEPDDYIMLVFFIDPKIYDKDLSISSELRREYDAEHPPVYSGGIPPQPVKSQSRTSRQNPIQSCASSWPTGLWTHGSTFCHRRSPRPTAMALRLSSGAAQKTNRSRCVFEK